MDRYKIMPQEYASFVLANEQHAKGNTQLINSRYQVEYVRPDGTVVPGYNYYLKAILEGRLSHDPYTGKYTIKEEA